MHHEVSSTPYKHRRHPIARATYTLLLFLSLTALLHAQQEPAPDISPVQTEEAHIYVGDSVIFSLKHGLGGVSVEERARLINRRLARIVADPKASPEDFEVGVDSVTGMPFVRHKRYQGILFTISAQDAGERSPLSIATEYAERLQEALKAVRLQQQRQAERQRQRELQREYFRAILLFALYTLALPVVWLGIRRALRFVDSRLLASPSCRQGVRWRGVEVLSAARYSLLLTRLLLLEHLVIYGALLAAYLQLSLAAFPHTKSQSNLLWRTVVQAISQAGSAILDAIPGLINIVIILVLARLILRAYELLFEHAEAGHVSLEPYVPQEYLKPTRSLGKFIIILVALFFIAPNIPGAGSDFAKVVTVFLGVVVSFSSTTTVGNFLAGVVLAYMRPFRRGDRVKIGDIMGDVVDSSFLYTRLRTSKNEDVLIPSLQILSGTVVNYSAAPEGVVLHTQVSIGYDTPRTQVELLLLEAAKRTEGCEPQPPPFVLIRSLNDFYVTYELNAYTRCPNQMLAIYSRLHENIKDVFDSAGVEIMSPHYVAVRDGNRVTLPPQE